MPLLITQAPDLVDVAIQHIWLKDDSEKEAQYPKYYNVVTGITDLYDKDSSLTGLKYAGRRVENATGVQLTPTQGYDKTYTQFDNSAVLTITKQMWFFGIKKRKLENLVQQLKKAMGDWKEMLCADRLDNGFLTSYNVNDPNGQWVASITGGDGLALFTSSHTREDSGTNNNNTCYDGTTYNMDFDYDALKAMHRTAQLVKNPVGKPMNIDLDTFVFSKNYANHHRAVEILGAIRKGWQPASADHEGSGVPDYKILPLSWITTNTAYWFGFDSKMKNDNYGLQFKESQSPVLTGPVVIPKTGEIQYVIESMFDLGFNDYRGWVGSKNTNAA